MSLQAASVALRSGSAALRRQLQVEDRFFDEVAQLAGDWLIKPAPDFAFSGGAAPYQVDLVVPGTDAGSEAASADLYRRHDGALQVNTDRIRSHHSSYYNTIIAQTN